MFRTPGSAQALPGPADWVRVKNKRGEFFFCCFVKCSRYTMHIRKFHFFIAHSRHEAPGATSSSSHVSRGGEEKNVPRREENKHNKNMFSQCLKNEREERKRIADGWSRLRKAFQLMTRRFPFMRLLSKRGTFREVFLKRVKTSLK